MGEDMEPEEEVVKPFKHTPLPKTTYRPSSPVKLNSSVLLREEANLKKLTWEEPDRVTRENEQKANYRMAVRVQAEAAREKARRDEKIKETKDLPSELRRLMYEKWQSNVKLASESREMEEQWRLERNAKREETERHQRAINELFRDSRYIDESLGQMYEAKHNAAMDVQTENMHLFEEKHKKEEAWLSQVRKRIQDERDHKASLVRDKSETITKLRGASLEEERERRRKEVEQDFRRRQRAVAHGLDVTEDAGGPDLQSTRTPPLPRGVSPPRRTPSPKAGPIVGVERAAIVDFSNMRVPWQSWSADAPPDADHLRPLAARPKSCGYAENARRWRPRMESPRAYPPVQEEPLPGSREKHPPRKDRPDTARSGMPAATPRGSFVPTSPRSTPRRRSPVRRGAEGPRPVSGANPSVIKFILAASARSVDRLSFKSFVRKDAPLCSFPERILHCPSIMALDLSDNLIKEFTAEVVEGLQHLVWLSLSNNRLKELPANIGTLSRLKVLRLGSNQLQEVPSGLGQLNRLTHLSLGGNLIRDLPASLFSLVNLEHLDVGSNQLRIINPGINKLRKLIRLDISHNKLASYPRITDLTALEHLDISGNATRTVPPTLRQRERNGLYIAKTTAPRLRRDLAPYLEALGEAAEEVAEEEEGGVRGRSDLMLSTAVLSD